MTANPKAKTIAIDPSPASDEPRQQTDAGEQRATIARENARTNGNLVACSAANLGTEQATHRRPYQGANDLLSRPQSTVVGAVFSRCRHGVST